MANRNDLYISNYDRAFNVTLGVKMNQNIVCMIKDLESKGHTEKSICYAIYREQDKLLRYKYDNRFVGILRNSIMKYSWAKDDPRWKTYWEKKNAEKEAQIIMNKTKYDRAHLIKTEEFTGKKADKEKGFVYFVQGECGGAIKIGYSETPTERLKQLQTGYPDILRIICLVKGNKDLEYSLHEEFVEHRLNGEWFKPVKQIKEKIIEFKSKQNKR